MKTNKLFSLLLLSVCLPALADRADMDRLSTDIQNHNRKLGEVITAKDAEQVRKGAVALREDVKSLNRKSVGLSSAEQQTLSQRMNELIAITDRIEKSAAGSDFNTLRSDYRKLQAQVSAIHSIAELKAQPGQPKIVGTDRSGLLKDIRNHNEKLSDVIAAKNLAQIKQETFAVREDAKALAKTVAATAAKKELDQIQEQVTAIVETADRLDRNAEKSEYGDARRNYQNLQPHLNRLEALMSGPVIVAPAADQARLLTDLQNNNVKLREAIADKDAREMKLTAVALREDARAFAKSATTLSVKEQTRLAGTIEKIIELTERVETNADQRQFGDVQNLYDRLQVYVGRLQSLATARAR